MFINRKTPASATKPRTAAVTARTFSSKPDPAAAGRAGAAAGRGAEVNVGAAGAGRGAGAAAPAGVAGAGVWAGAAGEVGAPAAATAGEGAAGTGILTVGAAVGLGGRLMRTVSFLGWIFAGSAGLSGAAPVGKLGMFSAIAFLNANVDFASEGVKHYCSDSLRSGLPSADPSLAASHRTGDGAEFSRGGRAGAPAKGTMP